MRESLMLAEGESFLTGRYEIYVTPCPYCQVEKMTLTAEQFMAATHPITMEPGKRPCPLCAGSKRLAVVTEGPGTSSMDLTIEDADAVEDSPSDT